MDNQISAWADDVEFSFDEKAHLTAPEPTIAVLTSNQLLRFLNQGGVKGDTASLQFDGKSQLDLPAFRAPKIAGGRSLQVKGSIQPTSENGVIFAHGENQNGYSIYLDEGHLCVVACVDAKRTFVRSSERIGKSANFEANWNSNGEIFLKVNGKLVEKVKVGIFKNEPVESIQIGGDLGEPVGDYEAPNHFSGVIENLSFKYPNGT